MTLPEKFFLDLRRQSRLLVVTLVKGGLYWIEESTRADDYSGHARIRRDSKTPIQIGENWWGPHDAAKSIEAGASDYVMPDAMKIGGVTGWLRTAALAEAAGIPLSTHLFRLDPRRGGDRDILGRGSRPTLLGG